MNTIKKSKYWNQNPTKIFKVLGEIVYLFDDTGANLVTLNSTGSYLWQLLTKPLSEKELVEKLTIDYEVSENQATKDVKSFVEKLKKMKFITSTRSK